MNVQEFNHRYPQFSEVSEGHIEATAALADAYLPSGCKRHHEAMLILLVAHMLTLEEQARDGTLATGQVSSASVGNVSVGFSVAQADKNNQWFMLTPYGLQFLTLKKKCSTPVFYVAGGRRGC